MGLALALLMVATLARSANDNTPSSPLGPNAIGRVFNHISIHPDGEHWLIDECTDRFNPPQLSCYLFLYNRTNQSYQRYDLDAGYEYADAQFSPTGKWIVAIRRKIPKSSAYEEQLRSFIESELVLLRTDGSEVRVLSTLKGRIKSPVMSPDESRIAYWVSGRVRPYGERTTFMNFDIHELDLTSGTVSLFAGPYRFYEAYSLQYKSPDVIVANTFGPTAFIGFMGPYSDKYGSSRIYCFERGERKFPIPAYRTIESATSPTIAKNGRTYLLGQPRKHGQSIIEADDESEGRYWLVPQWSDQGIAGLRVSPDSSYIVFTYLTTPSRSSAPKNNLGVFDLSREIWLPASIPRPEFAPLLRRQN